MTGNDNCKICRQPGEIRDFVNKARYEHTHTLGEIVESLREKGIGASISGVKRHWRHAKEDYEKSLAPPQVVEKPPTDLPDVDPLRKAQDELNRLDWLSKRRNLTAEESRRLYAMLDYLLKVRIAGLSSVGAARVLNQSQIDSVLAELKKADEIMALPSDEGSV